MCGAEHAGQGLRLLCPEATPSATGSGAGTARPSSGSQVRGKSTVDFSAAGGGARPATGPETRCGARVAVLAARRGRAQAPAQKPPEHLSCRCGDEAWGGFPLLLAHAAPK